MFPVAAKPRWDARDVPKYPSRLGRGHLSYTQLHSTPSPSTIILHPAPARLNLGQCSLPKIFLQNRVWLHLYFKQLLATPGVFSKLKCFLSAVGIERLKVMSRSLPERPNTRDISHCAVCGNCTLSAVNAGQIFLSVRRSRCPPPRTWVIDSGRGGHVVQLTLERHLVSTGEPEQEKVKFELKVRNARS